MYSTNKIGPSTLPCGMPQWHSSGAVLVDKCLIRVGISVNFCLMSHPGRGLEQTLVSRQVKIKCVLSSNLLLFHEFRRYFLAKINDFGNSQNG